MFSIITLSTFAIYFFTLALIGFYFNRKIKTSSDYLIGGHSTNYFVTAIAAQASDMGSWLFLAFPAAVYANGVFELWTAIGLTFFMFLNWHFIAPKLRAAVTTESTLPAFFETQIGDTTGAIRAVSAIISLIFFTFYIASSFVGLGLLFKSAFNINYHTGIFLGLGAATFYTLLGGFAALAWCDFFQGIFLLIVLLLVPITTLLYAPNLSNIITVAQNNNISLSLLSSPSQMINALLLSCGWGLGYFGQPHVLAYFIGIDDPKKIKYAKYIGISWQILALLSAMCVGLLALTFFSYPITDPQLIFIHMTQQLFHPFIAGFVLCGILAATLSTLDSHIFISGTTVATDLYQRIFKKYATHKEIIFVSRAISACVCAFALYLAWDSNSSIYGLVNYAWSGLASAFGPLVILCLYTKRVTRNGALIGMICGAIVSALWPLAGTTILPLIPGFFTNLLLTLCVFSKKR